MAVHHAHRSLIGTARFLLRQANFVKLVLLLAGFHPQELR